VQVGDAAAAASLFTITGNQRNHGVAVNTLEAL